MGNDERFEASNAIKDFIQTISPFVSMAMFLIGFIYVRQMGDNQDSMNKIADKMDKVEAALNEVKNGQTQMLGQLERHGEKIDENRKRVETVEGRQNDLEKTVILSNANK
jgi:flavodoxin